MSLAVGTVVKTPYGVGEIKSFREQGELYTIQLTNWKLSNDQAVFVYSQPSQFTVCEDEKKEEKKEEEAVAEEKKEEAVEVVPAAVAVEAPKEMVAGTTVKTVYGVGVIVEVREDTIYHVKLTSWTLSDNQAVHIYVKKDQLQFADAPATETATDATAAAAATTDVAVEPEEDDSKPKVVTTKYGKGVIVDYREADGIFHIELTSWVLSNDSKVHCYLSADEFKVQDEAGNEHDVPKNIPKGGKREKGCCNIM